MKKLFYFLIILLYSSELIFAQSKAFRSFVTKDTFYVDIISTDDSTKQLFLKPLMKYSISVMDSEIVSLAKIKIVVFDSLKFLRSQIEAKTDTSETRSIISDSARTLNISAADSAWMESYVVNKDSLIAIWRFNGSNRAISRKLSITGSDTNMKYLQHYDSTIANGGARFGGNSVIELDTLLANSDTARTITIMMPVYIRTNATSAIIGDYDMTNALGWKINLSTTVGFVLSLTRSASYYKTTHVNAAMSVNTWYFIAATFFASGAQPKLWVNGIEYKDTANLGTTSFLYMSTGKTVFGRNSRGIPSAFNGIVGPTIIKYGAVSQNEVNQQYQRFLGIKAQKIIIDSLYTRVARFDSSITIKATAIGPDTGSLAIGSLKFWNDTLRIKTSKGWKNTH